MVDSRSRRAKLNIVFSLIGQAITLICGLIVPRLLIGSFGSEAYGATASISQFLAYITLLEGGIGGVARAALYRPLAQNDNKKISSVICEIQRFFRVIALVFLAYVLVLACSFKSISRVECFDWISTFLLVIVISISIFAQYFIGISYQVLIQAAQKTYITQIISSLATILNTICIVILVSMGGNLIIVKLVSSIVFTLRPVIQYLYVRKTFHPEKVKERSEDILDQKWTGLGQHLAFFLHSNTDIAILTIMSNLNYVAIYSVYNMVVSQIQNVTTSFATGMEAMFGDMLAHKEIDKLHGAFNVYEAIISFVAGTLFSITAVMLIPFVKLYTSGINDVNYIHPIFGITLAIASYLYCLRMPYHSLTIAAGHFKQTKMAAYGEAIINISLSIILVWRFNLLGVAVATVLAVCFRTLFYVVYLSKNIFNRSIKQFIKRALCNFGSFAFVVFLGSFVVGMFSIDNYQTWCLCACVVSVVSLLVQIIVLKIFYRDIFTDVIKKFGISRKK